MEMIDDDPLELSRDIELPLTLKEIARTSSLNYELKNVLVSNGHEELES